MVSGHEAVDLKTILPRLGQLGLEDSTVGSLVAQTALSPAELPALWLALFAEVRRVGLATTLYQMPAVMMDHGLRIFSRPVLDLLHEKATAVQLPVGDPPPPRRAIILAGLPGAGKSTVSAEIGRLIPCVKRLVETSRQPRIGDTTPDVLSHSFVKISAKTIEDRRKASWGYPVVFRGERYFVSSGRRFLSLFGAGDLTSVWIDTHILRIRWLKSIVPEAPLVWLDVSPAELRARVEGSRIEALSPAYLAACSQTREIADFVVANDVQHPACETAKKILDELLRRRADAS